VLQGALCKKSCTQKKGEDWQRNGNREAFPSKIVDFESNAPGNSAMPGDLKGT